MNNFCFFCQGTRQLIQENPNSANTIPALILMSSFFVNHHSTLYPTIICDICSFRIISHKRKISNELTNECYHFMSHHQFIFLLSIYSSLANVYNLYCWFFVSFLYFIHIIKIKHSNENRARKGRKGYKYFTRCSFLLSSCVVMV